MTWVLLGLLAGIAIGVALGVAARRRVDAVVPPAAVADLRFFPQPTPLTITFKPTSPEEPEDYETAVTTVSRFPAGSGPVPRQRLPRATTPTPLAVPRADTRAETIERDDRTQPNVRVAELFEPREDSTIPKPREGTVITSAPDPRRR